MQATTDTFKLAEHIAKYAQVQADLGQPVYADPIREILNEGLADLTFTTKDHPEANGLTPVPGQLEWKLRFPLDDGSYLTVRIGRQGRNALLAMLAREDDDDANGEPSTGGVMGVVEALQFAIGKLEWFNFFPGNLNIPTCWYCRFCDRRTDAKGKHADIQHDPGCPYLNAVNVLKQLGG